MVATFSPCSFNRRTSSSIQVVLPLLLGPAILNNMGLGMWLNAHRTVPSGHFLNELLVDAFFFIPKVVGLSVLLVFSR